MRKTLLLTITGAMVLLLGGVLLLRRGDPESVPSRRLPPRQEPSPGIVGLLKEKEDYFKDPQRVNREIRLKPEPGDAPDNLRALTIDHLDPESPIYKAGFRKGDRVLRVNGLPVSTMKRAINLQNEIRQCAVLTVDVERDGRVLPFAFEFR